METPPKKKQPGLGVVKKILDAKVLTEEKKQKANDIITRLIETDRMRHKK